MTRGHDVSGSPLRVLCGAMATVALPVGLLGLVKYGLGQDWLEALYRLSLLLAAWLLGHVAFTGRLPRMRTRARPKRN